MPKTLEDKNYEANKYVALTTAQFRKSIVSNVSYLMAVAIPKGDSYFAKYQLDFELTGLPTKTFWIDFRGVKIANYKINDAEVEEDDLFYEHKIVVPLKYLKVGANRITLNFWNKYRNDGAGLHSFLDPVDKEQYLYTKFEPDTCHWFFPVFDQPDLKAKLTMNVVIPGDWSAISNDYVDPEREGEHAGIS